ncbi:MAG: hypothetical protein OER21_16890 [Gemmatimonadota bacterium]|nr:hypothetical protein [Gemmatimonadota bacterium]
MRVSWLVPAALLVVACGSDTPPDPAVALRDTPPVTITLRAGEQTAVNNVELIFGGVSEDSRCPIDVVCPSAGNAKVELGVGPLVGTRGPTYLVELNTTEGPRSGEAWDLRVVLLALRPEPVSTQTIKPEDYVVELRVGGVNKLLNP